MNRWPRNGRVPALAISTLPADLYTAVLTGLPAGRTAALPTRYILVMA